MELFKNTNFDFLGKKWPFIIASLVLTVLGLVSLAIKGGPSYGIEFKGGMLMTVKFQGAPPIDEVRSALDEGAGESAQRADVRKRFERNGDRHGRFGRRHAGEEPSDSCWTRWRRRSGIRITASSI